MMNEIAGVVYDDSEKIPLLSVDIKDWKTERYNLHVVKKDHRTVACREPVNNFV